MDKKVGILFLAEALHPGGAERQMEMILSHLDRDLFEPYLLTWVDSGQSYHQNKSYTWIQCLRKHKFDFSVIYKALKIINQNNIQIIHGILDTGNLYGGILKFLKRNIVFIASERSSIRKLSFFQKFHKPQSHKLADLTIANSQKGIEFLNVLGIKDENKLVFIPNGLDTDLFKPVDKEIKGALKNELFNVKYQTKVLLCVGSIYPVKNQIGILKAFAQRMLENTKLILVGKFDVSYLKEVRTVIEKYDLKENVYIFPAQEEISKWYQAADCLILNSDFEGTPNVILEGMASGLPIISTNVGDIDKYVDNSCGWLYTPNDSVKLVEYLMEIDSLTIEELNSKGQKSIKKIERMGLSKATMIKKHEELYQKLLQ